MKNESPILYLVVPCFNEEDALKTTIPTLENILFDLIKNREIHTQSKCVYVDDGSIDLTWNIIKEANQRNLINKGLKLSKNKGHQTALIAGLFESKKHADIIISLDSDLQDDPNAIFDFINEYKKGHDIVYGVRKSRNKDTWFKRNSALFFYKLLKWLGVEVISNHSDYRLLSKRVIEDLELYEEVNLFLRGLIPQLGYSSSIVYYNRAERIAGESKYPLRKMISLALDGITSFSIKPIRFIINLAVFFIIVSICIIIYTVYRYFIGETVTGWAFLNISLWFIAGVQTFVLAIIGEYVGKTFIESKRRPRYSIETSI